MPGRICAAALRIGLAYLPEGFALALHHTGLRRTRVGVFLQRLISPGEQDFRLFVVLNVVLASATAGCAWLVQNLATRDSIAALDRNASQFLQSIRTSWTDQAADRDERGSARDEQPDDQQRFTHGDEKSRRNAESRVGGDVIESALGEFGQGDGSAKGGRCVFIFCRDTPEALEVQTRARLSRRNMLLSRHKPWSIPCRRSAKS